MPNTPNVNNTSYDAIQNIINQSPPYAQITVNFKTWINNQTRLNATNDGYEWYPSLATDTRPIPVDENGNVLSVDHREFYNVIISIEELLELATELTKILTSTIPGYKGDPVNVIGVTEETADVETVLIWIKTIFGLDEKDLLAIHEIKSARQMARLKITPGDYYDAVSVMLHAEDHYVTQKIDQFAPLNGELVNLMEEFKNKNQ